MPPRGGRRTGAGRPPKSSETRAQKSVSLPPRVWAFVAMIQLAHPGESESDALERICQSHILFVSDKVDTAFECPGCGRPTSVIYNRVNCPACAGRD